MLILIWAVLCLQLVRSDNQYPDDPNDPGFPDGPNYSDSQYSQRTDYLPYGRSAERHYNDDFNDLTFDDDLNNQVIAPYPPNRRFSYENEYDLNNSDEPYRSNQGSDRVGLKQDYTNENAPTRRFLPNNKNYRVVVKQKLRIRKPKKLNVNRIIRTKIKRTRPIVHKIIGNYIEDRRPGNSNIFRIHKGGKSGSKLINLTLQDTDSNSKSKSVERTIKTNKYSDSDETDESFEKGYKNLYSTKSKVKYLPTYNKLELWKEGNNVKLNQENLNMAPVLPYHALSSKYNVDDSSESRHPKNRLFLSKYKTNSDDNNGGYIIKKKIENGPYMFGKVNQMFFPNQLGSSEEDSDYKVSRHGFSLRNQDDKKVSVPKTYEEETKITYPKYDLSGLIYFPKVRTYKKPVRENSRPNYVVTQLLNNRVSPKVNTYKEETIKLAPYQDSLRVSEVPEELPVYDTTHYEYEKKNNDDEENSSASEEQESAEIQHQWELNSTVNDYPPEVTEFSKRLQEVQQFLAQFGNKGYTSEPLAENKLLTGLIVDYPPTMPSSKIPLRESPSDDKHDLDDVYYMKNKESTPIEESVNLTTLLAEYLKQHHYSYPKNSNFLRESSSNNQVKLGDETPYTVDTKLRSDDKVELGNQIIDINTTDIEPAEEDLVVVPIDHPPRQEALSAIEFYPKTLLNDKVETGGEELFIDTTENTLRSSNSLRQSPSDEKVEIGDQIVYINSTDIEPADEDLVEVVPIDPPGQKLLREIEFNPKTFLDDKVKTGGEELFIDTSENTPRSSNSLRQSPSDEKVEIGDQIVYINTTDIEPADEDLVVVIPIDPPGQKRLREIEFNPKTFLDDKDKKGGEVLYKDTSENTPRSSNSLRESPSDEKVEIGDQIIYINTTDIEPADEDLMVVVPIDPPGQKRLREIEFNPKTFLDDKDKTGGEVLNKDTTENTPRSSISLRESLSDEKVEKGDQIIYINTADIEPADEDLAVLPIDNHPRQEALSATEFYPNDENDSSSYLNSESTDDVNYTEVKAVTEANGDDDLNNLEARTKPDSEELIRDLSEELIPTDPNNVPDTYKEEVEDVTYPLEEDTTEEPVSNELPETFPQKSDVREGYSQNDDYTTKGPVPLRSQLDVERFPETDGIQSYRQNDDYTTKGPVPLRSQLDVERFPETDLRQSYRQNDDYTTKGPVPLRFQLDVDRFPEIDDLQSYRQNYDYTTKGPVPLRSQLDVERFPETDGIQSYRQNDDYTTKGPVPLRSQLDVERFPETDLRQSYRQNDDYTTKGPVPLRFQLDVDRFPEIDDLQSYRQNYDYTTKGPVPLRSQLDVERFPETDGIQSYRQNDDYTTKGPVPLRSQLDVERFPETDLRQSYRQNDDYTTKGPVPLRFQLDVDRFPEIDDLQSYRQNYDYTTKGPVPLRSQLDVERFPETDLRQSYRQNDDYTTKGPVPLRSQLDVDQFSTKTDVRQSFIPDRNDAEKVIAIKEVPTTLIQRSKYVPDYSSEEGNVGSDVSTDKDTKLSLSLSTTPDLSTSSDTDEGSGNPEPGMHNQRSGEKTQWSHNFDDDEDQSGSDEDPNSDTDKSTVKETTNPKRKPLFLPVTLLNVASAEESYKLPNTEGHSAAVGRLCKLAKNNLKNLRVLVSTTYGLNTDTADENDLITIVYILGKLNEARATKRPVEKLVDDFLVNLQRLAKLRKLLCQHFDNEHAYDEVSEDITHDSNDIDILSLLKGYLEKTGQNLISYYERHYHSNDTGVNIERIDKNKNRKPVNYPNLSPGRIGQDRWAVEDKELTDWKKLLNRPQIEKPTAAPSDIFSKLLSMNKPTNAPPVVRPPYVAPSVRPLYVAPSSGQPYGAPSSGQPDGAPSLGQPYGAPSVRPPYVAPSSGTPYGTPSARPPYVAPSSGTPYGAPSVRPPYVAPSSGPPYGTPSVRPPYDPPTVRPTYVAPTVSTQFDVVTPVPEVLQVVHETTSNPYTNTDYVDYATTATLSDNVVNDMQAQYDFNNLNANVNLNSLYDTNVITESSFDQDTTPQPFESWVPTSPTYADWAPTQNNNLDYNNNLDINHKEYPSPNGNFNPNIDLNHNLYPPENINHVNVDHNVNFNHDVDYNLSGDFNHNVDMNQNVGFNHNIYNNQPVDLILNGGLNQKGLDPDPVDLNQQVNIPEAAITPGPFGIEGVDYAEYEELIDGLKDLQESHHDVNLAPTAKNPPDYHEWQSHPGKKFKHFNLVFNGKKYGFGGHGAANSNHHQVNVNGIIHKVDLENIVKIAQYEAVDHGPVDEGIRTLLDQRDRVNEALFTELLWSEIQKLRSSHVDEHKIDKYIHIVSMKVLPFLFKSLKSCEDSKVKLAKKKFKLKLPK